MERFVIIVNGFERLTIITKRPLLDVAAVPDPPLLKTETMDTSLQLQVQNHEFLVKY